MGFVIKHKMGASEPTQAPAWMLGLCWLAVFQTAGCASQPPLSEAPASAPQAITDFWATETPEAVTIIVKSDRPLTCTTTKQDNPQGLLLRFPETVLDGLNSAYFPPPNTAVRSIRATETAGNGREVQVLLELLQDLPYEVLSEAEGLRITFRKLAAAVPVSVKPAALKDKPKPAKAAPAPATMVIREVRAETRSEVVVIRVIADGPVKEVKAFTIDEKPAKIVFDLIGIRSAFRGEQRIPVQSLWVSQIRHAEHPDKVRLVAETSKAHLNDFAVKTVPEGLVIAVGKSAAAARQMVAETTGEPASRKEK
ncbi:MAG: AMIN domain-containing protein [Hyphomicrobiales bacterium]